MAQMIGSLDEVLGAGAESMLEQVLKRRLLNGVALGVVRDNRSYLRLAGEGIDEHTRFELGSLTKTYTAELLAILIGRGVVRLDDPLARFVPGSRQTARGRSRCWISQLTARVCRACRLLCLY